MPVLTPEEEIFFLEERVQMYMQHAKNLEEVLMNLVVAVERGLDIQQQEMQDLVTYAKAVIEGEFEE